MLRALRGPDGHPSLRSRVLAALVVMGLVLLTAPLVLLPVLRALAGMIR